MAFPTKLELTEKQRLEAEERFLNGGATTNTPAPEKTPLKPAEKVAKGIEKTYVLRIDNAEYVRARFNAAQLGITMGEYYRRAIIEKNNAMEKWQD